MAADQERAARIDALKENRPDLTWRRIADLVGVTERSAYNWKVTGSIDYENAKKLAKLFEVDVDYVWRGPANDTPDLSRPANTDDRLARIEQALVEMREERARNVRDIQALLERQDGILQNIEDAITREQRARAELDESAERLLAAAAAASQVLRAETPDPAATPAPPAK